MGLAFWTFSSPSFSQDSTVCIAPSTARYYLEREDEAILLREKDSISNQLIYNLSEVIDTKDRVIQTYQNDSIVYSAMEQSYNEHITYVRSVVVKQEREIKRQKLIRWGVIGVALAILLL